MVRPHLVQPHHAEDQPNGNQDTGNNGEDAHQSCDAQVLQERSANTEEGGRYSQGAQECGYDEEVAQRPRAVVLVDVEHGEEDNED